MAIFTKKGMTAPKLKTTCKSYDDLKSTSNQSNEYKGSHNLCHHSTMLKPTYATLE